MPPPWMTAANVTAFSSYALLVIGGVLLVCPPLVLQVHQVLTESVDGQQSQATTWGLVAHALLNDGAEWAVSKMHALRALVARWHERSGGDREAAVGGLDGDAADGMQQQQLKQEVRGKLGGVCGRAPRAKKKVRTKGGGAKFAALCAEQPDADDSDAGDVSTDAVWLEDGSSVGVGSLGSSTVWIREESMPTKEDDIVNVADATAVGSQIGECGCAADESASPHALEKPGVQWLVADSEEAGLPPDGEPLHSLASADEAATGPDGDGDAHAGEERREPDPEGEQLAEDADAFLEEEATEFFL